MDLYKVKEMANKQLEELTKRGELSGSSIDMAQKLTDIIKNVDKIEMLEESGNSEANGYWGARGGYSGNSYADSYDGGGGSRRASYDDDSMMSERRRRSYAGGNSFDGYSSHEDTKLLQKLDNMMRETRDEKERNMLRRFMDEAKRA